MGKGELIRTGTYRVHGEYRLNTEHAGQGLPRIRRHPPASTQNRPYQYVRSPLEHNQSRSLTPGPVFVTTDAICNIVQVAGGTLFGISQSGNSDRGSGGSGGSDIDPELGQNVLRAGLALQVVSWVIFIAFLAVAIVRANRTVKRPHLAERRYDPLRWYLWVVLVSSLLVLWRACYRLAEAITGKSTPGREQDRMRNESS